MKRVRKESAAPVKANCTCCGIEFSPAICSQCQVAGCGAKAKNEKCRLTSSMREAMQLSCTQLEIRYAELQRSHADLVTENRRLVDLVHKYELAMINGGISAAPPQGLTNREARV